MLVIFFYSAVLLIPQGSGEPMEGFRLSQVRGRWQPLGAVRGACAPTSERHEGVRPCGNLLSAEAVDVWLSYCPAGDPGCTS